MTWGPGFWCKLYDLGWIPGLSEPQHLSLLYSGTGGPERLGYGET
jgi:hypothetical protein